ncbi:MAG: M23 family metallopeptidase [Acidobacteria bacterium]|nr:M23 family metallopeptidase [Acidobacteriota bacterium]
MLVATYVLAIGIAGLWLVLPWWLPYIYGALLAGGVARGSRRHHQRLLGPRAILGRTVTVLTGALAVLPAGIVGVALAGRTAPGAPADLAFPLRSGTYLVVNGGNQTLINAHLGTLEGERFAPYRGQSYGVDLVRIDRVGLRVRGLIPADPVVYVIFGDPIVAPCGGRVLVAEDGAEDMSPPQADRAHMVGNHVILECGRVWIVLGHMQKGSVVAHVGQVVEPGALLGRVGNSGNTGEPHLHLHAQRPGSTGAPLSGEPVAVQLGGRYLVRNDRVHVRQDGS